MLTAFKHLWVTRPAYLEGFGGQRSCSLHHAVGHAQPVHVLHEGRHEGDILGPTPRFQQPQRPALGVPPNVVQDQVKSQKSRRRSEPTPQRSTALATERLSLFQPRERNVNRSVRVIHHMVCPQPPHKLLCILGTGHGHMGSPGLQELKTHRVTPSTRK